VLLEDFGVPIRSLFTFLVTFFRNLPTWDFAGITHIRHKIRDKAIYFFIAVRFKLSVLKLKFLSEY
jgi:hypothetical protein